MDERYINLDRRFRDLTREEQIEPSLLGSISGWEHGDGISWNEILESERVVVLAEAGSGKTRELQTQVKVLNDQEKPAFFIPIETLDKQGVREYLASEPGQAERFDSWLSDPEQKTAWFFLDSVDELKLVRGKLERALGKLTSALGRHANRARIIISSRPTDWQPVQDMEMFKKKLPESIDPPPIEKSGEEMFLAPIRRKTSEKNNAEEKNTPKSRCVVLLPLDRSRIVSYANARGVKNSKTFLEEISRRDAWTFARRPLDLQGLIDMWNASGRIGTLLEQHENSIENSLKDDPERPDNEILSLKMARDGVERLALAMVMTKTRTIRSLEQTTSESDLGSLDASSVLTGWTNAQVKALMRRPIFDPATYGRVRFHHRSIQEYLAARRLAQLQEQNLTKRQLKNLLFANTYGEKVVIPAMQAIAAWLSIWNREICREVLNREPEVLILHGDPESLSPDVRGELIRNYVTAYSKGGWRGLEMPVGEIQRLAHPDLAPIINAYLKQDHENEEVQEFLLKLVWLGGICDCADAAFQAAININLGFQARSLAIQALGTCKKDDLLRKIADDLLVNPSHWPDPIIHSAVTDLYPNIISSQELEQLIRKTPEPENTIGGFSWAVYNTIDSLPLDDFRINELSQILTDLIWEGCDGSHWYEPSSHFGYLAPALSKLCKKQIERAGELSPLLIRSCVIAYRFHDGYSLGIEDKVKIREILLKKPDTRESIFWMELEIVDAIEKSAETSHRLVHALHDGLLSDLVELDWSWLLETIKKDKDADKKEVALHGLIFLWFRRGRSNTDLKALENAVKNEPNLKAILAERSKPIPADPENEKLQKRRQEQIEKQEAHQRKIEQSWIDWKQKAEADPDKIFEGKRGDHSMWILVKWLQHESGAGGTLTRKNWPKIRKIMGDRIGDHFEKKMKDFWREEKPPIWSKLSPEKRNKIFNSQYAGLTGISIETSNPAWLSSLTDKEARRAAEWALTEISGFPEWFSVLAGNHPNEVIQALHAEIKAEMAEVGTIQHPHTLNALNYGAENLKELAVPFLKKAILKWPKPAKLENHSIQSKNLNTILSIILSIDTQDMSITDLCEERFLNAPQNEEATTWLHGLCTCDLKRGLAAFKKSIKKIKKAKRQEQAVAWIGTIFNNRYREKIDVTIDSDADILLELTELAFECVRRKEDVHHVGAYTPGDRDKAENARNRILNALIGKPGPEAYKALKKLAEKPLFAHTPDRLRILAKQRAAQDSDVKVLSVSEYRDWESKHEIRPKNRDELYEVMMNRLDDIEHDIQHHDFSDRETLVKIESETEMQPLLARKMLDNARGHYEVVREDEVADKKKTDIRLLAGVAGRSVIEVKIGDNWSVNELEDAIKNQLVGQYLRHQNCSAGVLLVTYAGRKNFNHPQTGQPLPFDDVIAHLLVFAQDIETKEQGRIRLGVMGLDLRSPLAKRAKAANSNTQK